MKTLEKLEMYRDRLREWRDFRKARFDPEWNEPDPAKFELTTPVEKLMAQQIRDQVIGKKGECS